MNLSTPGLPVHHQLLEFTQTLVCWVGDAIQPSHPLLSPPPPAFNLSQRQGLIRSLIFHQGLKTLNPLGAFDSLKQATVLSDKQCWLYVVKVGLESSLLSSPCWPLGFWLLQCFWLGVGEFHSLENKPVEGNRKHIFLQRKNNIRRVILCL